MKHPIRFLAEHLHHSKYLSDKEFNLGLAVSLFSFLGIIICALLIVQKGHIGIVWLTIWFLAAVFLITGIVSTLTIYMRWGREKWQEWRGSKAELKGKQPWES